MKKFIYNTTTANQLHTDNLLGKLMLNFENENKYEKLSYVNKILQRKPFTSSIVFEYDRKANTLTVKNKRTSFAIRELLDYMMTEEFKIKPDDERSEFYKTKIPIIIQFQQENKMKKERLMQLLEKYSDDEEIYFLHVVDGYPIS